MMAHEDSPMLSPCLIPLMGGDLFPQVLSERPHPVETKCIAFCSVENTLTIANAGIPKRCRNNEAIK